MADSTVVECDRNHQWGKSAPCDRPRPTFGTPSASFLLRPLLVFSVVDCSLFCFVDLFHRWTSKDTVNILLTCGVFRAYNFWIQRRKTSQPKNPQWHRPLKTLQNFGMQLLYVGCSISVFRIECRFCQGKTFEETQDDAAGCG